MKWPRCYGEGVTEQQGERGISLDARGELGAAELVEPMLAALCFLTALGPALGCLARRDMALAISKSFSFLPGQRVALRGGV